MSTLEGPAVGDRVAVLVDLGEGREAVPAVVSGGRGRTVHLALEPAEGGLAGTPIALMVGNGGTQRIAYVHSSGLSPGGLTLTTDGRWRLTFDRRRERRYPMYLACWLNADGIVVLGRCLDLSQTGAALETQAWEAREFALVISDRGERASIPCETRSLEPVLRGVTVHARFKGMSPAARRVIEALIERARREFDSAQAHLAGRPDDAITTPHHSVIASSATPIPTRPATDARAR